MTLAEKVRASILKGIKANTWLSKGKEGAVKKIKDAKLHLVKPDRIKGGTLSQLLNIAQLSL